MKRLGQLLTLSCIAIFFLAEVHSPWAFVVFGCGLIARHAIGNWLQRVLTEPPTDWLYIHAKEHLAGPLDARKCKDCLKQ